MSGCNYLDYLSPDALAELYAGADGPYDANPGGMPAASALAEIRPIFDAALTERQAA